MSAQSLESNKSLESGQAESRAVASVVDFHCHYLGPNFKSSILAGTPPAQRAFWESVERRLTDSHAIVESIGAHSGIAARVISTPLEFVQAPGEALALDTIRLLNDSIARRVSEDPGKLYGLATIDAYSGEAGANELVRAVRELGLRGAFIESARDDLWPDASVARPTFAAAAELGVPLFVHPVPDAPLRRRLANCGPQRERLVRSTLNSAAVFAMLESDLFETLPRLQVVVTALALNGVLLSGRFDGERPGCRQLYVDTTGQQPTAVRAAIALLGADRVLVGTDWPVVNEPDLAPRMDRMLIDAGLDRSARESVLRGNTLRLMSAQ